jgi:hypothetical protein
LLKPKASADGANAAAAGSYTKDAPLFLGGLLSPVANHISHHALVSLGIILCYQMPGSNIFKYSPITGVTIGNSVEMIDDYGLYNVQLTPRSPTQTL